MDELKPCPFCGGKEIHPHLIGWPENENYKPYWAIGCLECGAGYNDIFETKESAIKRWNLRNRKTEDELARQAGIEMRYMSNQEDCEA